MKFSIRLRKIMLYMAVMSVFCSFSSCICEDLSGCPSDISLRFSYSLNSRDTDLFTREVSCVDLFLYDQAGNYLKTIHREQSELAGGNTLVLTGELLRGCYTAVVWADYNTTYYTCDYDTGLENMRMAVNTTGGQVSYKPSHIYHALVDLGVEGTARDRVAYLTRNTHDLEITLKIADSSSSFPVAIGDCVVEVTGSNGTYSYDNSLPVAQAGLDYIQGYTLSGMDTLLADCRIERLLTEGDMRIRISDSGGNVINSADGVAYDRLLADEIMLDPAYQTNRDLDRSETFSLVYEVTRDKNGAFVSVTLITVNNWDVINQSGHV